MTFTRHDEVYVVGTSLGTLRASRTLGLAEVLLPYEVRTEFTMILL